MILSIFYKFQQTDVFWGNILSEIIFKCQNKELLAADKFTDIFQFTDIKRLHMRLAAQN